MNSGDIRTLLSYQFPVLELWEGREQCYVLTPAHVFWFSSSSFASSSRVEKLIKPTSYTYFEHCKYPQRCKLRKDKFSKFNFTTEFFNCPEECSLYFPSCFTNQTLLYLSPEIKSLLRCTSQLRSVVLTALSFNEITLFPAINIL